MSQASLPLQKLCDTAIDAARAAGQFIQSADRTSLQRKFKEAGSSAASQIVTEIDVRSEAIIREHLQSSLEQWGIVFVGEESSENAAGVVPDRLAKPCFWCVDPLDGTLPFVEGTGGYAVSIALVHKSGIPLMGVVYDPVNSTLMHAIRGKGAYRDLSPLTQDKVRENLASTPLVVFADASFRTHERYDDVVGILKEVAQCSGLESIEVVYGSGAVKNACQILDCPAACYVKLPKPEDGGGSIWDYAATACIVSEAEGWVSNIHGGALELNRQASTFMNHQGVLYASNDRIARHLIGELTRLLRPECRGK